MSDGGRASGRHRSGHTAPLALPAGSGAAQHPRRRPLVITAVAVALIVFVGVLVVVLRSGNGASGTATGPACTDKGGAITVAAAPDIAPTLTRLAGTYHPAGKADCTVQVVSASPAAVLAAAADGWKGTWQGRRPDVWVPDSALSDRVGKARPGLASLLPDNGPSLAESPEIVAMPRPMAEVIGWPDATIGWENLSSLLRTAGGWASYKHADWGPVRLGRRDDRQSTDELQGLMAVVAASAGTGSTPTLDTKALADVPAQSTIVALGTVPTREATDTPQLLDGLRAAGGGTAGLRYVSAFTTTEQQVYAYNRSAPPIPLAAVYPTDGSPRDDHPYLVLHGSWVGANARSAAAGFLGLVQGGPAQAQLAADGFRTPNGGDAAFTEANGLAKDAPATILGNVSADTVEETQRTWEAMRKAAYNLVVMSMGTAQGSGSLPQAKAELAATLPAYFDNGIFELWGAPGSFGRDHQVLVPSGLLGDNRTKVADTIKGLGGVRGGTRLYDVILAAYQQARNDYDPARDPIVTVYTTGRDLGSSVQVGALTERLQALADPARPVKLDLIVYGKNPDLVSMRALVAPTQGRVIENPLPTRGPLIALAEYADFIGTD